MYAGITTTITKCSYKYNYKYELKDCLAIST